MDVILWGLIAILIVVIIVLGLRIKYIKKELEISKSYTELLKTGSGEISRKCTLLELQVSQYQYFATSLVDFKDYKATQIVENKRGDLYIVMENYSKSSLEFWLSGKRHKINSDCPRLFAEISGTHIWIEDIYAIDENCGNGTLLLSCLFNKAKELGINEIRGELSTVDVKKFDKLEYFYKKNGFDVCFNSERTRGGIFKKL